MLGEKCYWCGKKTTSREHVPPKCLFPEKKDVGQICNTDYRLSLITVPSCDEHNLAKSHDDEYLMVCLASRVGNNGVAYIHTNTKIRRALERNPKFLDIQSEDAIEINDKEFPVLFVNVDTFRLMRSFEAIARALVFHEFSFTYQGRCNVISNIFLSPESKESTFFQLKSFAMLNKEQQLWHTEIKGTNPKIFTYQFSNVDRIGTFTVALTFYEKTVVYVIMSFLDDKTFQEVKQQMKSQVDKFLEDIIN